MTDPQALRDHVRRVVDAAPPLSQVQRDRVSAALHRQLPPSAEQQGHDTPDPGSGS